jgi:hypothetical protein
MLEKRIEDAKKKENRSKNGRDGIQEKKYGYRPN